VPRHVAHPSPEDLAALSAGDPDGLDLAATRSHLATCPTCQAELSALESVQRSLATLDEPPLPAGLHDRLIAAVQAEQATLAATDAPTPLRAVAEQGALDAGALSGARAAGSDGDQASPPGRAAAEQTQEPAGAGSDRVAAGADAGSPERSSHPLDLGARRAARRRRAWLAQPARWAVAAALLLAVVVVGRALLDEAPTQLAGGGAEKSTAAAPERQAQAQPGEVPLFEAPGAVDLAEVRKAVATRPEVRAALDRAASARDTQFRADSGTSGEAAPGAADAGGNATKSSTGLQPCLAAVPAGARPAFFMEGTYKGRPATILVTLEGDPPTRMGLLAFARGDCAVRLGSEQGPVTGAP
jgi:hypothetical protein